MLDAAQRGPVRITRNGRPVGPSCRWSSTRDCEVRHGKR
ncbi:MAG: hypothetical protein OXF93_16485 [Acidobacteria bacterium]|nr:hypothetical protein [Acidobacteriota bacterium]